MPQQPVRFYSTQFVDHLESPRHFVLDGEPAFVPNGASSIKGHVTGSRLEMWVRVDPRARVARIAWRAIAMPYVVATTSAMAEWIAGRHGESRGARLEMVLELRPDFVAELVGGLPGRKIHETVFGPRSLQLAIHDHFLRMGLGGADDPEPGHPSIQPPCECLVALAASLRARRGTDKPGAPDADSRTGCPICEAYEPGIRRWLELRRHRSERVF